MPMFRSSKNHNELSPTVSELDQSEFWKIVEKTKPEKLRALSDEEIRDCQNYFLEILDSTLPAYETVTASLRLILLRGEIDLRRSDVRHRQTQRLLRWAIRIGILSAVVAIVFGIANRPTPEGVPAAATEATEIPAIIPPTPATLATTTPAPTASPTMSVVRTRTPTTQKKQTGRTRRRRPAPTPSFWHQFFKPKSTR